MTAESVRPSGSCNRTCVATLGRNSCRPARPATSDSAPGPLSRTSASAPRPAGVACATIRVSRTSPVRPPRSARRDDDRLHEAVSLALGRNFRIQRDLEVHQAPRVRIQRSHLLRHPRHLGLLDHELGHLAQFDVLALPEIEAVDDDAPVATALIAPDAVHEVLKGVECLTLAPDEEFALLATDVHPDAVRVHLGSDRDGYPHRGDDLADELADLLVKAGLRGHGCCFRIRPAPAWPAHRRFGW